MLRDPNSRSRRSGRLAPALRVGSVGRGGLGVGQGGPAGLHRPYGLAVLAEAGWESARAVWPVETGPTGWQCWPMRVGRWKPALRVGSVGPCGLAGGNRPYGLAVLAHAGWPVETGPTGWQCWPMRVGRWKPALRAWGGGGGFDHGDAVFEWTGRVDDDCVFGLETFENLDELAIIGT